MAASTCSACGRVAGPHDRFCGACGNAITPTCPRCSRVLSPNIAFCTHCGQSLRPTAPPEGWLTQVREERRRVSVLFVDAIGSTPFAECSDPENVRAHQTDFFATVSRVVRQYGGVVEKYIGDAVMALFGAPVATETDAVRCVRAGLDLQRALARSGDATGWTFRVGIATGEALVDVAAAHDGGQAILAGDVVNTAARIQAEAPAGGVLVCGTTRTATLTEIRYAARPPATLRGRSTPTELWLAVAPVQQQVDEHSDAISMVGRDHELGLLTSALHHVIRERSPRLVTVLGRAGIGKSRLVRELYQHTRTLVDVGVCWRSGRCPPFGENVAYAALADIVRAHTGVLTTDSPQTTRERLDSALRDLAPVGGSARLSDAIRPLLGIPGSPLSTEDAESAWRRFLLTLAGKGPTVLVFEDVHWADDRMIRFIELIAATVRDVPLLVICTARPELISRAPTWAGAVPGMLSISLMPLRDDAIATLYAEMFAQAAFPPELLRPLVELADGMPLYAHEYGRMLVERGTLRKADHTWVMETNDELPMPESVHAVIANRIDLLDPTERAVLQAAAVVGARFWPGAIAAALRTTEEAVERALRTLAQRDLVWEHADSTMAAEPEYRFRHVLVSDVCYERLPLAERVAQHTRTADWLDERLDGRGMELAEVVAHHRYTAYETALTLRQDAGQYAGPALAALLHAARRAAMLNAVDAAEIHVKRAKNLVTSGHGEVDADPGDASRLGVELLDVELDLHRDPAVFLTGPGPDRLTELATLLYRARDHGGAARAWTLLGRIAGQRADRAEALRCLDRAVELFDSWPDTPEKAQAYAELGHLHMLNYEHAPAVGATQIAAEIAEQLGLVELQANALITIGLSRYQVGEAQGLADLREALQFCRTHHLPSLRRATQKVVHALREEGDRAAAETLLREAGGVTRRGVVGDGSSYLADGYSTEAVQALFAGDWDRFLDLADQFLDTPIAEWNLQIRGVRGWMRALHGDWAGASHDVDRALGTARASGFWRLQWTALAHGALVYALLGRPTEAHDMLAELAAGWRRMHPIASSEWVAAAAHAAIRLGPATADLLHGMLSATPHHTAWSRAAIASVTGALAYAGGDHAGATAAHLDAAERYAAAGSSTDRFLALSGALPALSHQPNGSDSWLAAIRTELAAFAERNRVIAPR